MKKYLLLITFCLLFNAYSSQAQGPPPPPPPIPLSGTGAPIDTDIAVLFIAAAAFGVWKLRNRKIA